LTEALLSRSPIPTIVVWDGDEGRREAEQGFRRVLVPVVSTVPSRAAQEVAFGLACANGAEVVIAHVDVERSAPVPVGGGRESRNGEQGRGRVRQTVAQGVVYEAADLARKLGVEAETIVRRHDSRAEAISELALELDADLVVLGSELQPVAGETFMGHLVERLIRAVHCSVAVVAMPRQALGMPDEPYPTS
jgi:nucleotide-binding universal stress UspA family protein